MSRIHLDAHLQRDWQLSTGLEAIEERAGVREQHAAFVAYHGDSDLRLLYFSVRDKGLRKELIAHCLQERAHKLQYTRARIEDAQYDLYEEATPGFSLPWLRSAFFTFIPAWIGFMNGSATSTILGTVAGLVMGAIDKWERITSLKRALLTLQGEEALDNDRRITPNVFSKREEVSGSADEWPNDDPLIHWYARIGDVVGVTSELARGVSVEIKNNENSGSRPLHRAAANCNLDVIRILIAAGADVHTKNTKNGWLALHYAAKNGCADSIKILLDAGSAVDARDIDQTQPIHLAAESGDTESIVTLLNAGAKIEAKGCDQRQPIHCAALAGHSAAVETLLAAGADPNAETGKGWRPIDCASREKYENHQRTVRILEQAGGCRSESAEV